ARAARLPRSGASVARPAVAARRLPKAQPPASVRSWQGGGCLGAVFLEQPLHFVEDLSRDKLAFQLRIKRFRRRAPLRLQFRADRVNDQSLALHGLDGFVALGAALRLVRL